MRNKINIVTGSTASGKSAYALDLAKEIDGIIINCDSMQIYREIPILTAQPTLEEQKEIPHRLYSIISVAEASTVAMWTGLAIKEINAAFKQGLTPIIVGGTGMYLNSLIHGFAKIPEISEHIKQEVENKTKDLANHDIHKLLDSVDKELAEKLKVNDTKRIKRALMVYYETGKSLTWWQQNSHERVFGDENFYSILISPAREKVYENINTRFDKMIENGVIEEVKAVYETLGIIKYPKAHGLYELIAFLKGEMSLEDAVYISKRNTRHYSKRQRTWFRHQMKFDRVLET